jgi:hypothetical protein
MPTGPDPSHMNRYCGQILIDLLSEVCEVGAEEATRVAEDVRQRAEAAAHLDRNSLEILAAPFFEEAYDHEPTDAPAWMKAITTVVIRNSWLEETHANGPVGSAAIQAITTYGLGPLSHLIAARRRDPISPQ